MTDAERKKGHSALRWNKDRQSFERFDPNPGIIEITDDERRTFETYGVTLTGDPIKDLHAVYSKMVERGEWDENSYRGDMPGFDFFAWLFCLNCPDQIPERLSMAANFIRKE